MEIGWRPFSKWASKPLDFKLMKKTLFICFLACLSMETNCQTIQSEDIPKYLQAFSKIQTDSINADRKIRISDWVVDLDRFWFKSHVADDLFLSSVLDSLMKFSWFDDFRSPELHSAFEKQNNFSERIVFFSLIEKNTLRADLFINRKGAHTFDEVVRQNKDKVYAYLFVFNKQGFVVKQFRTELIYESY